MIKHNGRHNKGRVDGKDKEVLFNEPRCGFEEQRWGQGGEDVRRVYDTERGELMGEGEREERGAR